MRTPAHTGPAATAEPAADQAAAADQPAPGRPPGKPSGRESGTVHGLFEQHAASRPEATAIVHGDQTLSYRQLDDLAERVAAGLRARGVRAGDAVGVRLPKSAWLVVTFLGVLKAGGAYVPVDPALPESRQRAIRTGAGARLLVTSGGRKGRDGQGGVAVEELLATEPAGPSDRRVGGPGDAAYILFTSGSTGAPKGVVVEHRGVVNLATNAGYLTALPDPGAERYLFTSAIGFDAATFEIWTALLSGGTLVVGRSGPLAPREFAATLRASGATVALITSPVFHLLVEVGADAFERLRLLLVGADVVRADLLRTAMRRHPAMTVAHVYGPTEATCIASYDLLRSPADVRDPLPLGRPLPGADLAIRDEDGRPAPDGEAGELWVGGLGVARGYLSLPELTADRFVEPADLGGRWYRTGDLVRREADGTLRFLGRMDRQVKVRGVRIELGEVETALRGLPGVRQALAVAADLGAGTPELVGYLVLAPDRPTPTFTDLAAALAGQPAHLLPSAFVRVPALPLTSAGKVDTRALPTPRRGAVTEG
jgi:amino acid adenylation domain-containing protein